MSDETLQFKKESIGQLQDRFEFLHENMEKMLASLSNEAKYTDAVSILFREFHTIKALVRYLEIDPMTRTIATVEDILAILRHKQPPISKELLDWMYLINDHILEWNEKVEKGHFDVTPVDAYTLNLIRTISITDQNPATLLKEIRLLVLSDAKETRTQIETALTGKVAAVLSAKDSDDALKVIKKESVDIIICDSVMKQCDVIKLILKIKKKYPYIPLMIHRLSVLSAKKMAYLQKLAVNDFIPRDFSDEELVQKLQKMAKSYAKNKGIKLLTSPLLKEKVEGLKPLPATIKEIQGFKSDPESSLRDIGAVVMKDAALCSKILKLVNSATFGLSGQVSSIQQGISLLGKERTIALSLQTFAQDSFEFDLSPYQISIDDFFSVANKRLNLAVAWYSKVSLSDTSLLSTAALIANIGQLLIVEEIKERGLEEAFAKTVDQFSPRVAEIDFLNTTSEDMTADILGQWGVEEEMADLVRYSSDLLGAPDTIKHLAVVMYVINMTVPMDNRPCPADTVAEMCDLLDEMNLDSKQYKNAVGKVLGI